MEVPVSKKRRERRAQPGAAERARRASGEAPGSSADDRGRFSAKRKTEAIMRLLRGEDLDTLSREMGVTAAPCRAGVTSSWPPARLASRLARRIRPTTKSAT
jgi:hypothetical protein